MNMNIKAARLASGITQQAAADKLGIKIRTLQSWEQGYRKPSKFVETHLIKELQEMAPH